MEFLVFDVKARYAHFRKIYTNSSSLSYSVPPRTTIEGLIAAILGYERDSYYDIFSSENLKIAVKKLSSTRKIVQSLNYIKATSIGKIISPDEHTQIPFEILTGENGVGFRIYVNHTDDEIFHRLEELLKENKVHFIPYLGAAPFNCSINYVGKFKAIEEESNDFIKIETVIRKDLIDDNGIDVLNINGVLIKEKMPRDFLPGRVIKEVKDYLYEENGNAIRVKLKSKYYNINNENIVLM